MMNYQLLVPGLLDRSSIYFPKKEIISREGDGVHRYTYRDLKGRVNRLCNALAGLGVGKGDRVGTFGWNTFRHLEAYFAPPTMGAVTHTTNIRLSPDDLTYIVNHAGDKVMLVDPDLVPILEPLASQLETVEHFVIMTGDAGFKTSLPSAHIYEELLADAPDKFAVPPLDENDPAGLCYTSATTGRPKGVTYTHRAQILHAMMECSADAAGVRERDVVMAVVPMFHANSWGVPYSATMTGATQVLTGVRPDPAAVCRLISEQRVTISLGVPTIWVGLLDFLARTEEEFDLSSLRAVVSGGSAVPVSMIQAFKERLGVDLVQAYGMTEASPLVSYNRLPSQLDGLEGDARFAEQGKQGAPVYGVEMRLVDENGVDLEWDGEQRGELLFRGPWIASEYLNDPRSEETFIDGWYHSGDIASVDELGNIQIGDRVKDMVKSGGEWISSVDLETAIIAHPGVLEAAVIAVPHPTWQERPLACVVPNADYRDSLQKDEVLDFIRPRFASWWMPDDVVFIDEIPKTSVGKFDKKALRDRYQNHPTGR